MYKMAVMGDKASIFGFASIGLNVFPVEEEKEAKKLLKRLCKNDYAVIYITEALAENLKEEIDKYRQESIPAIILIPELRATPARG